MRSGSPVFQRTLIGTVEAGDALKAAARGKLHRGDVFILRKGLQRNDLLYADIVDEVPQIDADIFADEISLTKFLRSMRIYLLMRWLTDMRL